MTRHCIELAIESLEQRRVLDASVSLFQDFDPDLSVEKSLQFVAALHDEFIFTAEDEFGDIGLWKTDGTSERTRLLRVDRSAGSSWQPFDFIEAENKVFFQAQNEGIPELWVTDGSSSGTNFVTKLTSAFPFDDTATTVGDRLFFHNMTAESGNELWVSDGTLEGTHIVKDILPGDDNGMANSPPVSIGAVYFRARIDRHDRLGTWVTDGTESGTQLVFESDGNAHVELFAAGDRLLYWESPATITQGTRTYKSRATLQEFDPLTNQSSVIFQSNNSRWWPKDDHAVTASGGVFFASLEFDYADQTQRDELWYIATGEPPVSLGVFPRDQISDLTTAGETLYFRVGNELWASDGSMAGTSAFAGIDGDVERIDSIGNSMYVTIHGNDGAPRLVRVAGGNLTTVNALPEVEGSRTVVFAGNESTTIAWTEGEHGLFSFNTGFDRPTRIHGSLSGPTENSFGTSPLTAVGGGVLYSDDGLWFSDGSEDAMRQVADYEPFIPVSAGGKAFFNGNSGLSVSDGTLAGTHPLRKADGTEFGLIRYRDMIELNGSLYFIDNRGFWKSDGTADGTVQLSAAHARRRPSGMTTDGESIFFVSDKLDGPKLWKSDGTAEGTQVIVDLPWELRNDDVQISGSDGRFVIISRSVSEDSTTNLAIETDGTPAGTMQLPDTRSAVIVNGNMVFVKRGQLWFDDGTMQPPQAFDDAQNPLIYRVLLGKDTALFRTDRGIWATDGTLDGTSLIVEQDHIEFSYSLLTHEYRDQQELIPDLLVLNDYTVFSTANHGVWQTDGTPEGTKQLTRSKASSIAILDNEFLFVGHTEFHGNGIYRVENQTDLQPGDSNGDGIFDSADLVTAFQHGEYEDDIDGNSSFAEGDWNRDGDFDSTDFVFAFRRGSYAKNASIADDLFAALEGNQKLLAIDKGAPFLA